MPLPRAAAVPRSRPAEAPAAQVLTLVVQNFATGSDSPHKAFDSYSVADYIGCFTYTREWAPRDVSPLCPNPPAWLLQSLVWCWILSPVTHFLVEGLETRAGLLGLLFPTTFLSLQMPVQMLLLTYGWGSSAAVDDSAYLDYFWPPNALADYALGALVAALAWRHRDFHPRVVWVFCGYTVRGFLADGAAAAYLSLCFTGVYDRFDSRMALVGAARTVGPLVALFLYGSSGGGGAGLAARALRHPVLLALGDVSLAVYLMHYPLANLWLATQAQPNLWSAYGAVAFLATLVASAALYTELVDKPVMRALTRSLTRHDC